MELTDNEQDLVALTPINADDRSHISVKNPKTCCRNCPEKPCTYICPSQVYRWDGDSLTIEHPRCVECGACVFACPRDNILFQWPRPGCGITYEY